jgi:hypothetical protein
MENVKNLLEVIKTAVYEISKTTGDIKQGQRNQLKADIEKALCEDLISIEGVQVTETIDGHIVEAEHEELGAIVFGLKVVMKKSNYDIEDARTMLLEKQAEQEQKEMEKQIAKAKKIAQDKKKRAEKAKAKQGE